MNEIKMMTLFYILKLIFCIYFINKKKQKINKSTFAIFEIIMLSFKIQDKQKSSNFYLNLFIIINYCRYMFINFFPFFLIEKNEFNYIQLIYKFYGIFEVILTIIQQKKYIRKICKNLIKSKFRSFYGLEKFYLPINLIKKA